MKLDVQVCRRIVGQLYRERDEYVFKYLPDTSPEDFVSLTMPVRQEPWRWPRDLYPFFRQNLPEGYLLNVIREEFGPMLDGTDLSLLAVVGGTGKCTHYGTGAMRPRRACDTDQLAHMITQFAAGGPEDAEIDDGEALTTVALGRQGGLKVGREPRR